MDWTLSDKPPDVTPVKQEEFKLPYTGKTLANVPDVIADNFQAMATEYQNLFGEPLKLNDAFRTRETQAAAYRAKPKLAAPPGHSKHELGRAFDIDETQANKLDQYGMLEEYGFHRPMMTKAPGKKYEPWHIQAIDLEKRAEATAATIPENKGWTLSDAPTKAPGKWTISDKPVAAKPPEEITAEMVMRGAPEAGYIEPIGTGFGKVMDMPFVPLRKGLEKAYEYLIEPAKERSLKEWEKALETAPEMIAGAPEAFAPIGSKEAFVTPLEYALAPTYLRLVGKSAQLLKDVGKANFYRYAPQWLFKPFAKGGMPVPLSSAEVADKLYAMSGPERAKMARKYPQFRDVLDEMTNLISKEREPYSPEVAARVAATREGLPAPAGLGENFTMKEAPPEIKRRPFTYPEVYEGETKIAEKTIPTALERRGIFPEEEPITKEIVDTAPQTRPEKITEHEAIAGQTKVNDLTYAKFVDLLQTGEMDKARTELATITANFSKNAFDHHFNPLNIMGRLVDAGVDRQAAKEIVKTYERDVFKPVRGALEGKPPTLPTPPAAEAKGKEAWEIEKEEGFPVPWQMTKKDFLERHGSKPQRESYELGLLSFKGWGEPGLTVEPRHFKKGSFEDKGIDITYRNKDGLPIAIVRLDEQPTGRLVVDDMGMRQDIGLLKGKAAKAIRDKLSELGVTQSLDEIVSPQAARLWHRTSVKNALEKGYPVPPEVLADYPDLAPKPRGEAIAPEARVGEGVKLDRATAQELRDAYETAKQTARDQGYTVRRQPDGILFSNKETGHRFKVNVPAGDKSFETGMIIPRYMLEDLQAAPDAMKRGMTKVEEPVTVRTAGEEGFIDPSVLARPILATIEDTANLLKNAPENFRAAGEAIKDKATRLWDYYRSPIVTRERNYHQILGEYLGESQMHGLENDRYLKTIVKAVPEKVRREAIVNWIQAAGDDALLRDRADASIGDIKKGYEAALNLSAEEKAIAQEVSAKYDYYLQEGQAAGIIEHGLEDYVNQLWKRSAAKKEAVRKLHAEINAGLLNTNFKYAKKRIFDNYFEGEKAGYTPANKDIAFLLGHYDQSMYEAIAARRAIKALSEGVADDGRPLVAPHGKGGVVGEYDAPEAYLIRPKGDFSEAADGRRYRVIDHPALRKWKWVGKDPDGAPIYLQGDLAVHPDVYRHLNNVLKRSAIREYAVGRAALKGSQNLKGVLLSGLPSGFHQVHLGSHAIFHKVNPFTTPPIDFADPVQQLAVKNGLMVYNHNALAQFAEGLHSTGIAAQVPGIGRVTQMYGEYLFQDLIPRLKMKLFKEAFERNKERYTGKYSEEQIAEMTANQSNAAFGELNYKAMGRNPTMQDMFRLLALAPDFLEARFRFLGQALKPGGREQFAAMLRAVVGMYGAGVIANMLLSDDHQPHWNKPFTLVIGKNAYSLRSIPGDMIHLVNDPRSFVYHRLNPTTARTVIEFVTSRDVYGRLRNWKEQVGDFFRTHIPIPIQGQFSQGERTMVQSALQSVGISSYKYKTGLEDVIKEYQAKRAMLNLSPEDRERGKLRRKTQDLVRDGKPDEAIAKMQEAIKDKKVDVDTAASWLEEGAIPAKQVDFKRMPLDWQAKAMLKATPEEYQQLIPILVDRIDSAKDKDLEKAMPFLNQLIDFNRNNRGATKQ